jgi:hypothetical protein
MTEGGDRVIPGLVSVVIPVHDRPVVLVEAVHSALEQTYRPIEIVIVDDGSTDRTGAVADRLAATHPGVIHVIHQANGGPGVARQRGLEASRGEYIQFLDSDDLLLPEKFAGQVAALQAHPECQICYGRSFEEDHSIQPPKRQGPIRSTGIQLSRLFPLLLVERWWTTSSPLYRRHLLDRIGPWQAWINEEDWEYDARAGATGAPLAWVPLDVSVRRIHMGDDHLSREGTTDPRKLSERARAQASIYRSARQAGVDPHAREMGQFARSAFLLCRQCGAAGVPEASRNLFHLAREASPPGVGRSLEYRLYGLLAACLGWCQAARVSIRLQQSLPRLSMLRPSRLPIGSPKLGGL